MGSPDIIHDRAPDCDPASREVGWMDDPASEFLKKGLSGKYILVWTCPDGQADFLIITHYLYRKMAQITRNMLTMHGMGIKSLNP